MRIFQFIEEYCKDLVEEHKRKKQLIDLSDFPHDGISVDVEGNEIPVVYIDGENVPVSDFFTMDKSDFLYTWKLPSAEEMFDNYLAAVEILEGEDVINRVRNAIDAERVRLEQEFHLVTSV